MRERRHRLFREGQTHFGKERKRKREEKTKSQGKNNERGTQKDREGVQEERRKRQMKKH